MREDYHDIKLRLVKDVPMFHKGLFLFIFETNEVYWYDKTSDNPDEPLGPLRHGLAGYLWLLRYEPGYFRRVKEKNANA